jgi:methionine synthase II (cobalamin-independent)
MPDLNAFIMMMISGSIFALTLFYFLEAFYYTEPYIIGAVSYLFPLFTESIGWITNPTSIARTTIIGTLITASCGLIVFASAYLGDKKTKTKRRNWNNAE